MTDTRKIQGDNTVRWLRSFEKRAGRPVIVSLLVEKGDLEFVSCVRKSGNLANREEDDSDEGGDDETPIINLEKLKKQVKAHELNMKNYIG